MDLYVRHGARARGCLGRLAYGGKRVAATLAGPVISLFARRPPGRRIPSDVLLLHGYDGGLRRAAGLRRALEDLGLAVADHILETRLQRLLRRRFGHPGHRVPLRWRLDAYYAGYLLWRYAPKIVVCSEYRSPLVACLRLACAGRSKLINIAHSVVPLSEHATMFDYDYYFVLGPSSVEHCEGQSLRFGATRLVEGGHVLSEIAADCLPAGDRRTIVFFSQLSSELLRSSRRERELVFANTRVVIEFARRHPDFTVLVKLHPLEAGDLAAALARGVDNVRVLDRAFGLREAVASAALAVVMWSNAAIDAAMLGRPVVRVNCAGDSDSYLEVERYFLPPARSAEELFDRVTTVVDQYDRFVRAAAVFVARHVRYSTGAESFVARCIASVARGREEFVSISLPEQVARLTGGP